MHNSDSKNLKFNRLEGPYENVECLSIFEDRTDAYSSKIWNKFYQKLCSTQIETHWNQANSSTFKQHISSWDNFISIYSIIRLGQDCTCRALVANTFIMRDSIITNNNHQQRLEQITVTHSKKHYQSSLLALRKLQYDQFSC